MELPVYTYVGVGAPYAHVPGVAFEVHAYANTQVTVPTAGAGVGAPTTGTLTDVVQAHMAARITDSETPLAEYAVAQDAVLAWIDGNIETTARDSAKLAIHHGLGVVGADRELQNAYTFVTAFHPKALDVWMNGFVTESITAYINRDNQTSCVKGISERIITGLRGVDSALDSIFAQPEAIAHAKTLISLLNPSDPGKLAWIVNSLRDLGVTPESSAAEAMARFKTFLLEKLGEHGLSAANMAEYTSDVESGIALSLEEYYYSHIKPALASASAGTASVAGAGVASL